MSDDCIATGPGDEEETETSGAILDSEVDDLYGIEDEDSGDSEDEEPEGDE